MDNSLKIYKNSDGSYEATRGSKLYSFLWNEVKYIVYNFKKLGTIGTDYKIKGKLVKNPHIQMIMQVQNKISEKTKMFVTENLENILRGKSPKEIINSKSNYIKEQIKKFNNALNIIEFVVNDEQMVSGDENYMGFLNMSIDFFRDPKMQNAFRDFVKIYNDKDAYYKEQIDFICKQIGLYVEDYPDLDETIIAEQGADPNA